MAAVRLLLLDGQGSPPSVSSPTNAGGNFTTSVPPVPPTSSSPLAAFFLRQAHASLRSRFVSLPAATRTELELDSPATAAIIEQLCEGHLCLPTSHATLLRHPLVSLPSLYIAQVVRILEELEFNSETLLDASGLEIIGYSSGLLPALLVATSLPPLSLSSESEPLANHILNPARQLQLLSNALALFDLTVMIGIHTELARSRMHAAAGLSLDDPARDREWSVVVFGVSRETLQGKVDAWNAANRVSSVYLPPSLWDISIFFRVFASMLCNFHYHYASAIPDCLPPPHHGRGACATLSAMKRTTMGNPRGQVLSPTEVPAARHRQTCRVDRA